MNTPFPFTAIVGQDNMKLALILTAIDPKIGGVLVFGDRGTGKSTAIRAFADLLPPIKVVSGCPINRCPTLGRYSVEKTPKYKYPCGRLTIRY